MQPSPMTLLTLLTATQSPLTLRSRRLLLKSHETSGRGLTWIHLTVRLTALENAPVVTETVVPPPLACCADVFLPTPDSLLVNMTESRELVYDLLDRLPAMFEGQRDTGSALGPALQAAYKLMVSRHPASALGPSPALKSHPQVPPCRSPTS